MAQEKVPILMVRSEPPFKEQRCIRSKEKLLILFLFACFLPALSGCWLTDRSKEKKKIGPHIINNPNTASGEEEGEMPAIAFDEKTHDFGTISQGEKVKHPFVYRNEGEAPLVIVSIEPSCGCTVAEEAPEKPIMPGGSDTLTVTYDSKGHRGKQNRSVSIVANTSPKTTKLRLKGTVKGPR
ncbi:MAG: DUF1573 domain-containing protein [Flavobacteriales bacterium]